MSAMSESLKKRAEIIIELALTRGAMLATVESCTAGSLAHLLSQADGASAALHGGFVVYTKENKIAAVGVPEELLAAQTAVNGQVAQAMAAGGLARCPPRSSPPSRRSPDGSPTGTVTRSASCMSPSRRATAAERSRGMSSANVRSRRFAWPPWARRSICWRSSCTRGCRHTRCHLPEGHLRLRN